MCQNYKLFHGLLQTNFALKLWVTQKDYAIRLIIFDNMFVAIFTYCFSLFRLVYGKLL